MSERIEIDIDGDRASALLGLPTESGPRPGILVAHHREGLSRFTADVVDRLAALDYTAVSVDNYHAMPANADEKTKHGMISDGQLVRDLEAGIRCLTDHPRVDAKRLAILGHCMGGRTSLLGASLFPVFQAAVVFYSGHVFRNRNSTGPTPGDQLKDIRCPVIGFFGERDRLIPNPEVDRIEETLRAAGTSCEFIRYPEAGHAFSNFESAADYRAADANDSWNRTVAFLQQTLDRDRPNL